MPANPLPVAMLCGLSPQASCWGVSWYQPLVQLPRLAAAAAGHEALSPQGAFTVAVQPPLPLMKAVLHGPEVQLTAPADEELAGLTGSSSSTSSRALGSSSSSSPSPWTVAGSAAAAGAAAAAAAGVSELDKKVSSVLVFEGQTLSWTLNLANISAQAVTGCKITVLNAKGIVIKPLSPAPAAVSNQQQQQLPSSFSGAHMEVGEQVLAAGLPLNPGGSVSLPVAVTVGKPPGDAFDAVMLQVRITYHGTASSSSSSSSSSSDLQLIGRRLTLPIRLSIQPTLQIKNIRFLQQTLPLLNGHKHTKLPSRLLQQHQQLTSSLTTLGPDSRTGSSSAFEPGQGLKGVGQLQLQLPHSQLQHQDSGGGLGFAGQGSPGSLASPGSSMLRRHASHHVRNSSDGAVPVLGALGAAEVSAMLLAGAAISRSPSSSPTRRGLRAPQQQQCMTLPTATAAVAAAASSSTAAAGRATGSSNGSSSSSSAQQTEDDSSRVRGSAPAPAAAAAGWLAVGSEPVLELAVRNASERYFRAWLGCLPDLLSAEHALSAVAVLEPGDTQRLLAALPAAAGPAGSPAKARPGPAAAAASSSSPAECGAATNSGGVCAGLAEPSRLACAEGLVERLVVCWEMITGAAAAGQLPRGKVQLAPVELAASLTPGAVAALRPAALLLRFAAPPAAAAAGSSCPAELADLASLALAASSDQLSGPPGQVSGHSGPSGQLLSGLASLISSGLLLPGLSGPLWGLHMAVGEWLCLDLDVCYSSSGSSSGTRAAAAAADASDTNEREDSLQLLVTLHVTDLLSSSSSSISSGAAAAVAGAPQQPRSPFSATPTAASVAAASSAGGGGFAGLSPLARGSSMRSAFAHAAGVQVAPAVAAAGVTAASSQQGLVDAGVFLVGCYSGLQVKVAPGSRERVRLQALLVQPGLYQFGVADVVRIGSSSSSSGNGGCRVSVTGAVPAAAAAAEGVSSAGVVGSRACADNVNGKGISISNKVYFNQDRMYVLVSS
ncbi:hypothetical protein COO60DRAFT_151347 [Scenedesmus sp. NREL 46B-D3]|nr:hypothetical protein COO60DRAFT_151347 [Scenedesmus sp. NREL 46B-D3]